MDQSIQKRFYLILKTEALLRTVTAHHMNYFVRSRANQEFILSTGTELIDELASKGLVTPSWQNIDDVHARNCPYHRDTP